MATELQPPLGESLRQLLERLGITRAHFAGGGAAETPVLLALPADTVASLTRVGTWDDAAVLRPLATRLLVVAGDRGPGAPNLAHWLAQLPSARHHLLQNYVEALWSDVLADRTDDVGDALLAFLADIEATAPLPSLALPAGEGAVAGISYRLQGAGPPLVLLPFTLAASQWEPLIPRLSQRYTTITLGGAALGAVALLEARAREPWYGALVGDLAEALGLQPGEVVLDVGCGTGALVRWLAQRTAGANPLVAVDVNRYLLREAAALARAAGLAEVITFRDGTAEALPFPADCMDVSVSVTVLEEVNAERALQELVRVTKPGGRVGVVVRAQDMPWWVNAPLDAALKAKAEAPGGVGVAEQGCADASLYHRFRAAGLTGLTMQPQLAVFGSGLRARLTASNLLTRFTPAETLAWQAAVNQAEMEGTFFIAQPFHFAVGTKPR